MRLQELINRGTTQSHALATKKLINLLLSLSLSMVSSATMRLGSSLPVPNVQELSREPIITVPQRYLRPDLEFPASLSNECLPAIPTIDMKKLLVDESLPSELERLHYACKDWGFFQLVNHGVSLSLIEKMKSETQELFNLPLQEKKKYWQKTGSIEGLGQSFIVSENQKLDWGDRFFMVTLPTSRRNHSLLEKLPLVYRETVATYALEVQKLALHILGFVAKALGMDVEEINEVFADGYQAMRSNYYPPCPQPQQVIGLTPHSDANAITILLQINEVQGLEIKKDGMWIPVKPIPNAFIINVGDMLEIITNGTYQSVLHRGTVNSKQERLSVAAFCSPRLTAEIGPSRSLIGPQNPPLYRRVIMEKYLKDYFGRELKDKSMIETMKISREKYQNIYQM